MRWLDNIVNEIGQDKVLHFLVAALFVALFSPLGWISMILSTLIILILELVKEKYLDTEFSWTDVAATAIGCAFVLLFNILL